MLLAALTEPSVVATHLVAGVGRYCDTYRRIQHWTTGRELLREILRGGRYRQTDRTLASSLDLIHRLVGVV